MASSYGQIFKSTAFTAGSSIITLALGVVRTKVIALLLGPAGVGLVGVYSAIVGLASSIAGMGIGNSGVRQIAEAASSGDAARIARTCHTLRRTVLVFGLAGALGLAAVSPAVSRWTFGDASHASAIALLGVAVFLSSMSGGQTALIQGLRRIGDLMRVNVFGAIAGTAGGLPLLWWLGFDGIVPMLIIVPAAVLACSWWFAKRVQVTPLTVTWRETAGEARALLGLGVAFMMSALMAAGVAYLIRLLVVRQLGIEAAGHYAAAYTLSGIYAGFILQAMGVDYYPRLTAVAKDSATVNQLVNEQSEIALLLAVPGVLATLVLTPWIIQVFYAGGFEPAVVVLQWQILGVLGRVISWPIGFILLARGLSRTYMLSEILANGFHALLVALLLPLLGLEGTGMAFVGCYLWVTIFVGIVCVRETGFRWSAPNVRLLSWALPLVGCVFLARQHQPGPGTLVGGLVATMVAGFVCFRGLLRRVPEHRLQQFGFLRRWR